MIPKDVDFEKGHNKKRNLKRKNTLEKNIYMRKVNTLRHVRPKPIGAKFQIKRYTVFEEALEFFSKKK